MIINQWFPTFIGIHTVEPKTLKSIQKKVQSWIKNNNLDKSEEESVFTTYHSKREFLQNAGLNELADEIGKAVTEYCTNLGLEINGDFIVQSWVNKFESGSQEEFHTHYKSIVCGCFYVFTEQGSGKFIVQDPVETRKQWMEVNDIPTTGPGTFLTANYEPNPGQIFIFQPWMRHGVSLYNGKKPRISIAFNIVRK